MGIQVMVGVVEEGRHRVLDFLLPSWLHGQVITFVGRETGDHAVLEPIEYLDWSAYGGSVPYRPCSRDQVAAAVGEVVRVLRESGPLFTPSDPQWTLEVVLGWYERLDGALREVDPAAEVHVDAC